MEDNEMLYKEINTMFTQKVEELIQAGAHINTMTMSGTQGEVAKVDLTDGKVIYRVLLEGFTDRIKYESYKGLHIIVGKCTDKNVLPDSGREYMTVWNSDLEIIEEHTFYEIGCCRTSGETFYGTEEEAHAAAELRNKRSESRGRTYSAYTQTDITAKALPIAIRRIQKDLGIKNVNKSKVHVQKYSRMDEKKYYISYGSKYTVKLA